jgi:hypothetical protein
MEAGGWVRDGRSVGLGEWSLRLCGGFRMSGRGP